MRIVATLALLGALAIGCGSNDWQYEPGRMLISGVAGAGFTDHGTFLRSFHGWRRLADGRSIEDVAILHVLVRNVPAGARGSGGRSAGEGPHFTDLIAWQVPASRTEPQATTERTLSISYEAIEDVVLINGERFDRSKGNLFVTTLDERWVAQTRQGAGFDERPVLLSNNDWESVMQAFRSAFAGDKECAALRLAPTYDYGARVWIGGDGKPVH